MDIKVSGKWMDKETACIAAFLSVYVLYGLFGSSDFALQSVSQLYISQATLEGIDVAKRVALFHKAILTELVLLPLFYTLVHRLKRRAGFSVHDLTVPSVLSVAGFFLVLGSAYGINNSNTATLLLVATVVYLVLNAAGKKRKHLAIVTKTPFFIPVMVLSLLGHTAVVFLFNSEKIVAGRGGLICFLCMLAVIWSLFWGAHRAGIRLRRLLALLLPSGLVPLSLLFSIELFFHVRTAAELPLPYKWIFAGLVLLGFLVVVPVVGRRRKHPSLRQMLTRYYYPAALLSFLLFTIYTPFVEQPGDMFELANPANAQMRIFAFGEIPIVDFMSSHMLSEQFPGVVYHLLHGYDGSLSFLVYGFLPELVASFIVYCFVARLMNSGGLSLLFFIVFPFAGILFPMHLFFGALAFFAALRLITLQSVKNWLFLFLTLIFLITWRLDVGYAGLLTTAVFVPILYYTGRQELKASAFIRSVALLAGISTLITVLVLLIRPVADIAAHFRSVLHYISADQAHGYSHIAGSYPHQFHTIHIVLPFVAGIGVVYSMFTLRSRSAWPFALQSALFFFLMYLLNFPRGIVRHGFMEMHDSTLLSFFYLATALLVLARVNPPTQAKRFIVLFGVAFTVVLLVRFFPLGKGPSKAERFLRTPAIQGLDASFNAEGYSGRMISNPQALESYAQLCAFLDTCLHENQTFFDFSNTPMLYYYSQRRIPSYFCQNLQNSVDEYLQLKHLQQMNPADVPVVVFSNYPPTWFDNTDGVPNTMRQYILAEYIFQYYKPLGIIGRHSIWIAKQQAGNSTLQPDTIGTAPQTCDYKKGAGVIDTYIGQAGGDIVSLATLRPIALPDSGYLSVPVSSEIACQSGLYLRLHFSISSEEQVRIELMSRNNTRGTILFTTTATQKSYSVRLSNHYLWHTDTIASLRVFCSAHADLTAVEFLKDSRK